MAPMLGIVLVRHRQLCLDDSGSDQNRMFVVHNNVLHKCSADSFNAWKWERNVTSILVSTALAQVNSVFLALVLRSIYISKSSQDSRNKKGQKTHSLAK